MFRSRRTADDVWSLFVSWVFLRTGPVRPYGIRSSTVKCALPKADVDLSRNTYSLYATECLRVAVMSVSSRRLFLRVLAVASPGVRRERKASVSSLNVFG